MTITDYINRNEKYYGILSFKNNVNLTLSDSLFKNNYSIYGSCLYEMIKKYIYIYYINYIISI